MQYNNWAAGNLGLSFKTTDMDKRRQKSNNLNPRSPGLKQIIEVYQYQNHPMFRDQVEMDLNHTIVIASVGGDVLMYGIWRPNIKIAPWILVTLGSAV